MQQISRFTKPEQVEATLERNRFLAERAEGRDEEVVIFGDQAWSGESSEDAVRERFLLILEMLEIKDLRRDQLLAAGYVSTLGGGGEPWPIHDFAGERPLLRILNHLADERAAQWADDPNDFEFVVEVRLPNGLVALVRYESEEAGITCAECAYDVDSGYSCEHFSGQYAYRSKYSVCLGHHDPQLLPHRRVNHNLR